MIDGLKSESSVVVGGGALAPLDADPAVSAFVPVTLLRCDAPVDGKAVHAVEAFGPVCTVMP